MNGDRMIIGVMTGTSMDAIDASLVRISGAGYKMRINMERFESQPLGSLGNELRELANGALTSASEFARLGLSFGETIAQFLDTGFQPRRADLVVLHGQTIYHKPPLTWQLINPWPVAARLRTPVLYDLRRADLACGGQGAPLTPIADAIMLGADDRGRAIVNLGGFCNVTLLPALPRDSLDPQLISGMDICPCNHWLDRAAKNYFDIAFDEEGERASKGNVVGGLREKLHSEWAGIIPRTSLGSDHEGLPYTNGLVGEDVLATLCDVIGSLIAESTMGSDEILCAGGSTRNSSLMDSIRAHTNIPVLTTQEAGVDPLHREAVAMAVLGALSLDGLPIGLESVTGVKQPIVSGSWCFPDGPHTLRHG
ncbi:MAG: hypothetical protein ED559_07650 [Phycisphaera sp.]|nr:MAG: hypothetical protein ED559_07650 [Phycisphaera sp.]